MTKPIVLLAALTLLPGCYQSKWSPCLPCEPNGFKYANGLNGTITHCIPCSKAKTPEQRFVCFGETVEAPSTFETRVVVGGGGGGASVRRGYPLHKTREYKDQDGKIWSEYSKETK